MCELLQNVERQIFSFNIFLNSVFTFGKFIFFFFIFTFDKPPGLERRVFANGPVDLGSIPGRVIPNTLKMVLDTSLLNTQQFKVHIKGKVEQSRERTSTLPYTLV